jgi:hypothetical protein
MPDAMLGGIAPDPLPWRVEQRTLELQRSVLDDNSLSPAQRRGCQRCIVGITEIEKYQTDDTS